jgi:hypothetical protein
VRGALLSAIGLWAMASFAAAQTVSLAPSETLRCMTPSTVEREALNYPADAFERKEGGVVRVEMTFHDPGRAPTVKVLGDALRDLEWAVRDHVSAYRVPCLAAGQQAVIRQDFNFVPSDGRRVLWTRPRDAQDRRKLTECLVKPQKLVHYPTVPHARNEQGTVALRLTFTDAVSAPTLTVLDDMPSQPLINAASSHALETRLPCHEGGPVDVHVDYQFRIEGGERVVLKDGDLAFYLGGVEGIRSAQVYFDFRQMKCPFDVRVRMRQPAADNAVGEVAESVPERAFFLDWLSRQRLRLSRADQNRVMGQRVTVSVPCTVLSLGNRSGGGASQ